MRWFKHFSDARNNPKFRAIQKRLGEVGYARAFKILEIVAQRGGNGEAFAPRVNLNHPHTNLDWIADELGTDRRTARATLKVCAEVRLIDFEAYQQNILYVPQMREYLDEWTRKKQPPSSGGTPGRVRSKSPQSKRSESNAESDPDPYPDPDSESEENDLTANHDKRESRGPGSAYVPTYLTVYQYLEGKDPSTYELAPWMRTDPWHALGIDRDRVPKEFRLDAEEVPAKETFEAELKLLWECYRIDRVKGVEDDEEGSPGGFAEYVLDYVQREDIKYPPVLLKRKKALCGS
jgi:hypothetical protein